MIEALRGQSHLFTDTLKRLLRRSADPNIRRILKRTHPVDLSHVFDRFLPEEQQRLLALAEDEEYRAEVVASLPLDFAVELISSMPVERVVELLSAMSGDDRADILGELDEEVAAELIAALPDEDSDEVAELLRYGATTAGGIMSPDALAISQDVSAEEAIKIIQSSPDVEMAFYIYVVNDHHSLVGVLSLRQLVISRPNSPLEEIMNPHVVSVRTDEDQEDVARIVARYDLLAVPVVDDTNKLVGMVTVDDVIDVLREEATEDILKMAGAGEALEAKQSVLGSFARRAPWLAVAWGGGVVASIIIGHYEQTLTGVLALAAFIPIIIGMAGNVGTQSLAIVVRGLATRRTDVKQFWRVLGRELAVGLLLGVLYGAALGGWGLIQMREGTGQNLLLLAGLVGSASAISMLLAAVVGATMPLLLARLRIDPAVATGPFVTTTIDVLGVLIYFNIINVFL
jgi:magnesium transporter